MQTLSGTAQDIFYGQAFTTNAAVGITITNVPYALYDVVVYSLAGNVTSGSGTQTSSVTVTSGTNTSTVQQSFTTPQTGYTVATVPIGSNSSVTNENTIVFQGLNCQSFELQGNVLSAVQIVERPYDQGTPTSYAIQRALGTSGSFATVGTVSGTTLSFTDSSCSASTAYQYRGGSHQQLRHLGLLLERHRGHDAGRNRGHAQPAANAPTDHAAAHNERRFCRMAGAIL